MTKHYGRMTAPTRLEFVRTLPGPIERVWEYLTRSDLRQQWFAAGQTEPRVGGVIAFEFDHSRLSDSPAPAEYKDQCQVTFAGRVTAYEPPKKLAFSWPEADGESETHVTIALREIDDGVELHLTHEHLVTPSLRDDVAAGWHAHLDLLEDNLAGRPVRDFWLHHTPLEVHYRRTFAE